MSKAKQPTGAERLSLFIQNRHQIWIHRANGVAKPWTLDPILQQYRFCNVYRELDTVTLWIAKHWRDKHSKDPNLWFNLVISRLINWPETLAAMGYFSSWKTSDQLRFTNVVHLRQQRGEKAYSGAYIVSTNGVQMDKADYLAERVLTPLWKVRESLVPCKGETLEQWHSNLSQHIGMGSFLSAQVVADLKYAKGGALYKAEDWHTFAASGPGSRRGLNRVLGKAVDAPWREAEWRQSLANLQPWINARLPDGMEPFESWEKLHAQDLQNCLCEFDKYERTRLGEGRPRSTYPGVI